MTDEPKTNLDDANPMNINKIIPDDRPVYVPPRRKGVDRRFFPPMELPAKPTQGELPLGRRKP